MEKIISARDFLNSIDTRPEWKKLKNRMSCSIVCHILDDKLNNHLTDGDMASKLGISSDIYDLWMDDGYNFNIEEISKIITTLKLSLDGIFNH